MPRDDKLPYNEMTLKQLEDAFAEIRERYNKKGLWLLVAAAGISIISFIVALYLLPQLNLGLGFTIPSAMSTALIPLIVYAGARNIKLHQLNDELSSVRLKISYVRNRDAMKQQNEIIDRKKNEILQKGDQTHRNLIEYFDKILREDPKNSTAWHDKGLVYHKLGEYEQAIKCYDQAIAINDSYIDAWKDKGRSLYDLKNYTAALNCYDQALKILERMESTFTFTHPKTAVMFNNKGKALEALERYDDAIVCYDKAISLNQIMLVHTITKA